MVTRRNLTSFGGETDTLAFLPQKADTYTDYISNPIFNQFLNQFESINYEYTISSFITVDGTRHFSQPLSIQAKPENDITVEPIPTNFVASDDLPDHVKLCWDWEAAKQSEFVIFRGETPIDTVAWTVRAYYDYDAPSSSNIEYQIASYSQGVLSAKVKALGGLRNEDTYMTISGTVYDQSSTAGVPDVLMRFRNLGGYSFNDVPKLVGRTIFMSASSNEAVFPSTSGGANAFDFGTFSVGAQKEYC